MDTLPPHADNGNTPLKRCPTCPDLEENKWHPATLEYFSQQKSNKDSLRGQCKKCQSEYRAAYYAAHREEERQRNASYGIAHREDLRLYSARYREEHPEEVKQSNARYNEEHKEERRLSKARYNAQHQEERREYRAEWHREHREHEREYSARYNAEHHEERINYGIRRRVERREEMNEQYRRYRRTDRGRMMHCLQENKRHARKRQVGGTLTVEQIQEKLRLQHYRCYYTACGHMPFEKRNGRYIFHLEHTIPVSRTEHNPRHDINYVVLACPSCNLKKNNKLPHEFFEGGRLL